MCTLLIILGISTIINATLFNYKYLHHGLGLLLIILTEVSGNALFKSYHNHISTVYCEGIGPCICV